MKKNETIGLLTYQNTLNFGAALQCFALYYTCEKYGKKVEIIDYRNEYIENSKNRSSISVLKRLVQQPLIKKRKKAFEKFNLRMNFSDKFYNKEDLITNPPDYDKYILGSDQVWSHKINGGDTTYLLDFVKSRNKFSYASSFGVNSIPDNLVSSFETNLTDFRYISVRENSGKNLLRDLGFKNVTVVNDPVFLLTKNEWKKQLNMDKTRKNQVFSYFLDHHTREQFETSFQNKGKKIVKLSGGIKIKDFISSKTSIDFNRGPLEFLGELDNSDVVYTDSFHATVFSIIMEKKFVVFLRNDNGKDSRILNVLQTFGLTDCIYRQHQDLNDIKKINYDKIRPLIEEARNYSIKCLYENILSVEKI